MYKQQKILNAYMLFNKRKKFGFWDIWLLQYWYRIRFYIGILFNFLKWILQIAYNITCFRNQNNYYKDPIVTKISKFEDTKIPFLITRFFQRCSLKQILLLSFIAYHKPYAVMFYCKTSRIWKIISVSILSIC